MALLGPQAWEDARERAVEHLGAYLEELSVLERAGAAGPSLPWMDVPAAERRRVLAEYGVTPRWTGRRRSQ